jgi:hypothetical protein
MNIQPLTRELINERFAEVIEATADYEVVYEDILGEGEGGWDANPRYPARKVNCFIWLQLVISEVYGKGVADKTAIMDRIRYFGGHVGFSMRKHYIDQWAALEPAPLVPVDLRLGCETTKRAVRLDPQVLLADRAFPCPLYKMNRVTFEIEYWSQESLLGCVGKLRPGYYVMFAVAADRYIECYPGNGPMGLVHSIILRVDSPGEETGEAPAPSRATVFHASTAAGRVLTASLETYVEKQRRIHLGYALYELDPLWDFRRPVPLDDEARSLLELEARIPEKRQSWGFKDMSGTS